MLRVEERDGRHLALQLAVRVQEADVKDGREGNGMGAELVGAIRALLRVKHETMVLNRKVAEVSARQEAADKARFYLKLLVYETLRSFCMRPYAPSVGEAGGCRQGTLLVYEALSYKCLRPSATGV
jgi:hypothetical protein